MAGDEGEGETEGEGEGEADEVDARPSSGEWRALAAALLEPRSRWMKDPINSVCSARRGWMWRRSWALRISLRARRANRDRSSESRADHGLALGPERRTHMLPIGRFLPEGLGRLILEDTTRFMSPPEGRKMGDSLMRQSNDRFAKINVSSASPSTGQKQKQNSARVQSGNGMST